MVDKSIIRVFPRRTSLTPSDPMAFVGDPPFEPWRPVASEVHISVTFTWDIERGKYLAEAWGKYYPIVKIGGPAFGDHPNGFIPGMYLKQGVTFTTRGCNNKCPWCLVPEREGRLVEIEDFAPGYIIQDNNFLQSSQKHQERVFDMLRQQKRGAWFTGGLQASLVTNWFAEQLKTINIYQLFLAADTIGALRPLEKALNKLSFLGRRKLRVYTLIAFEGETIPEATDRLEEVWKLGGMPHTQLYQPSDHYINYPWEWRNLSRMWIRPAAMVAAHNNIK